MNVKTELLYVSTLEKNEIDIFLKTESVGFKLFRNLEFLCYAFEANNYLCVSNLNNQILLLRWQSKEIHVFDLFHISNQNTLAINECGEKGISLFCYETGDETYVYNPRKNKLVVLFYKSSIKSLLSLCITIVLRVYFEADLLKLKLPRAVYQLLKY